MSLSARLRQKTGTQTKTSTEEQVRLLKEQERIQGLQKRKEQEQAVLNTPLVSKLPTTPIAQKPILAPVLPTLKAKAEQEQGLKAFATQKKASLNQITPQEQMELESRNLQTKEEAEDLTEWEKKKLTLPGNVFYKNLSDAFTFGLTGAFDSKAYNKAFEETEKENKVQAVVGNIAGSLGGQGILYKAVNKALAGTKLAQASSGLKGFGSSQAVQLVADAIVQAPIETINAIQEDKTLDEATRDFIFNRGIDLATNLFFAGGEAAFKGAKNFFADPRVKTQLEAKGTDVNALTKAIDEGDIQKAKDIIYVNQFGVASKEPFEQLQLPAPKKMDDLRNWRSESSGNRLNAINNPVNPVKEIKSEIPISERTFKEIGNQKIKAFQYENPEVKPFYKEKANELLLDLKATTKGEKSYTWEDGDLFVGGIPRNTSPMMAEIKDSTGATYEQIEDALNRIINDAGQENQALAKRIEVIIDEMLVDGYKRIDGEFINPNIRYIQTRNRIDPNKIEIEAMSQPKASQLNNQMTMGIDDQKSIFDFGEDDDWLDLGSKAKSQQPNLQTIKPIQPSFEIPKSQVGVPKVETKPQLDRPSEKVKATQQTEVPKKFQRIEEPGVVTNFSDASSKPQGLYLSDSSIVSPHQLGGNKTEFELNKNAKVLSVATDMFESNRGPVVGESAGIAAARKYVGDAEVKRMMKMNKNDLINELSAKYPDYNWKTQPDQHMMVEGVGAIEARKDGYDGIWAYDKYGQGNDTNEFVALNENAIKQPTKPQLPQDFTIQKPKYPPLAKDFTTERPFTVTPSEVSKVEQFKQFKAQNPVEQVNGPEVDDKLLKKFRLDLFGASKEKPVDAIIDGVEVRVTELFDDEAGKKIARLSDGREVDYNSIKPSKKYKPFVSDDMEKVIDEATNLKDIGTTERYTTDVYRNFEKVFGKGSSTYKSIKKALLDPFDKAKGNMADDVIKLTDDLKKTIVDGYGIKPRSKESKLVMRFGEGRIEYQGLVNQVGKEKADKIVRANQWFREKYDNLLDEINVNRINMNKPVIEKRQDYYRHYNEIASTFENIKNILDQGRAIDPRLSGLSEYTKPREAWASFKQRRTDGTKFTEDAVGGFLDYIKAGTYAKHIDPMISEFRTFRNQLANETTESRNLNKFIEYLEDYADDLSGKTNPFDRWIQKAIGREKLAVVNAINSRVKANAVLGNLSSSLSQIANVPQGIAVIKNPVDLSKGIKNFIESIVGGGDAKLYKQSSFLKERFLNDAYSQFNMRLIDKPKQAAVWTLGALDEVGTKFIWSSAHAKAVREGIENPIKYADDLTRKLIAGRGIGEIPLLQKSNVTQLVAPFTLEVNNLWKVMKDMVKEKDIAGLSILFIGNYVLNKGMEATRGSDVVFDPINAIVEGYDKDSTFGDNLVSIGGSLAGETLSNMPLGSSIASAYPEYGARVGEFELPSRAELFGESDPTRYGISLPIVKAIQDPLKNLVLPWGGAQVSKTIQGAKTMGLLPQNIISEKDTITKETLPASVTKTGKIRTAVEPTPLKTAQALAFGGYASPEVRGFFESKQTPFGENQTPNIYQLSKEGFDLNKLTDTLSKTRDVSKKEDRRVILEKAGYSQSEISRIMQVYFGYKE